MRTFLGVVDKWFNLDAQLITLGLLVRRELACEGLPEGLKGALVVMHFLLLALLFLLLLFVVLMIILALDGFHFGVVVAADVLAVTFLLIVILVELEFPILMVHANAT